MEGRNIIRELQAAGFNDAEIADWAANERKSMSEAGFAEDEIDAWFGKPKFNPKSLVEAMEENKKRWEAGEDVPDEPFLGYRSAAPRRKSDAEPAPATSASARQVTNFHEALEAGWQISVSGLMRRNRVPDMVVSPDAPMASRIAGQVGTLAGDFPAMVGGFLIGGGAGAATGPGAAITGTAGAFALPAALRATLMDAYEKGEFDNFSDFWDRASGIMIDTGKVWITGAATGAAGQAIPAALPAVSPTVRAAATVTGEVATMVTVGKALEGEVPSAQDFVDAAIVIGGLKGATYTAGKMRSIYARTGVRPAEIVADARRDPTIAQDLLSDNVEMPRAYGGKPGEPTTAEPAAAKPRPALAEGSVEAAQETVLSKISVGDHSPREPLTFQRLYTMAIDDLNPIKQATKEATSGEKLPTAEDPYQLARLTRGTFGKADVFLEHTTYDFKTYENTGKSLKAVLEPVADDLNGLRAYAASRRAVELKGRGIESGIDAEAAGQVVKAGREKYEPVLRELVDYQNRLVKYLRDSGVLSKEAYDAMFEANKNYVPFFRVMDEGAAATGAPGRGVSTRDPIHKIKGSERDIIDPIESVIKNTYLYVSLAERNAVGVKFVEMANKSGAPEQFITKVNPPIRPTTVTEPEMVKFLQAHGIEKVPDDLLTVFRAARTPLAENEIAVFEGGKRTVYEVQPDVARAFKGMDVESVNLLVKILAVPARALRAGSVLSPDFMARNVTRDFMSAFVNSKGFFSPIDTMRGAFELVRRGDDFENWMKSGGANATLMALDRRYLQENVFKLSEEAGLGRRAWNVASSPLQILRVTSELLENSTRLGEFKKLAGGSTDKATIQAAGFASREVTLDFARIGTNMRALNMISTFLNAHVQGLDRVAREVGNRPVNFGVKVAAGITIPSILLWMNNKDDPRWADIPRWQKDLFWIVMTDKHVYRIPKPHELGIVFGSVPERLLEAYYAENPQAFKDLEKTLLQAFVPDMMPTVLVPIIEQALNRSSFTGNPIIPSHIEKLMPEYQYTEYTTEATKALATMIGAFPGIKDRSIDDQDTAFGGVARALTTPVLMENYIRGWTGGLGMYALKLADGLAREAGVLPDPVLPAKTLADLPIVRAFVVRYPSATAQSIQDFYDKFYANKRVWETIQAKAKEGDAAAVEKESAFRPEAMAQLDGMREVLATHSQIIRLIHKNPDISADEKRQLIDTMYFRMIEIAKAGNEALAGVEAAVR